METPTISIVMPAYNVAPYIGRAIDCIKAQTFDNWELIIVDDAATDDTYAIASAAESSDARIHVLRHKQNRGLSEARNAGMDAARGKYLWFCDPDDTYDPKLLKTCLEQQGDHPADVVVFGVDEEYYDSNNHFLYNNIILPEEARYTSAGELRPHVLALEQNTCLGYAWNKLYRLSYLKAERVRFQTIPLIEDIDFNIRVFQNLNSLTVISEAPYRYARRLHTNLTSGFLPQYDALMHQRIQLLRDQQASWGLLNECSKAVLGSLLARYVLSAAERNCAPEAQLSHKDRRAWCHSTFNDSLFRELIPYAKAQNSKALKVCLKALQKKSVGQTLMLGRLIHIARSHFLPLFTKIKSGR